MTQPSGPERTLSERLRARLLLLRDLTFIFLVFSYLGHLMEALIMLIGRHIIGNNPHTYDKIMSNLLEPYTIYGFGAVILYLFERYFLGSLWNKLWSNWKLWQKTLATFLIATLLCAILEFSAALYMTIAWGGNPYWDYSHIPFNLFGLICLSHSLFFGLVASIFITLIPKLNHFLRHVLPSWITWLTITILITAFSIHYLFFN
ncbi:putative ABC transporter permease [Candidatus Saccharibacteria bacterium]|nr:putative ABC transporter permease [Candidatus Saccharibacteria bacterium]